MPPEASSHPTEVKCSRKTRRKTPSWIIAPRDATLDASISNGGNCYLRWSFADLGVSREADINRDKIAISDIRVTGVLVGDYNFDSKVDAAD